MKQSNKNILIDKLMRMQELRWEYDSLEKECLEHFKGAYFVPQLGDAEGLVIIGPDKLTFNAVQSLAFKDIHCEPLPNVIGPDTFDKDAN